jgi:hypothetical protein
VAETSKAKYKGIPIAKKYCEGKTKKTYKDMKSENTEE